MVATLKNCEGVCMCVVCLCGCHPCVFFICFSLFLQQNHFWNTSTHKKHTLPNSGVCCRVCVCVWWVGGYRGTHERIDLFIYLFFFFLQNTQKATTFDVTASKNHFF